MKTKSSLLILLAVSLNLCLQAAHLPATQITFVSSPPPRNQPAQQGQQGQGQQGQQGQKGLPAEKKKSLSKYGPEDVFPSAREQDDKNPQSNRQTQRRSTNKPQPSPSTTPAQTPTVTPALAKATPTLPSPSPTAAPLAAAAMSYQQPRPPNGRPGASPLVPVALVAASVLVLGALIYVVGMLRKRLREGR